MKQRTAFFWATVVVGLMGAGTLCKGQTITGLGFLPGGNTSYALALSEDGSAAAGYGSIGGGNGNRAFRWTASAGMQNLGALPQAVESVGYAVSADGTTVTGYCGILGGPRAFRWTAGGGMLDLGLLPGGANEYGVFGSAVSGDGSVIAGQGYVSIDSAIYPRAFIWTAAGGMENLGVLPRGAYSLAYGISRDGAVVIGNSDDAAGNFRAFRWTRLGGMEDLQTLPGRSSSEATAVSADGSTVVGTS